ncbi:MAG TPA: hypothetical protein VG142_08365 [Trebonia sp.]|nr:hypothetical protein [Trebonia sp.]
MLLKSLGLRAVSIDRLADAVAHVWQSRQHAIVNLKPGFPESDTTSASPLKVKRGRFQLGELLIKRVAEIRPRIA